MALYFSPSIEFHVLGIILLIFKNFFFSSVVPFSIMLFLFYEHSIFSNIFEGIH